VSANISASAQSVDVLSNAAIIFTATASGASSYNWNFGDGTVISNGPANVSHTYAQVGTYQVTIEASNGICNSVASTSVEVVNTTGLNTVNHDNIQVISEGNKITILFGEKMEGIGNIELVNMLGELVTKVENVPMKGTKVVDMAAIAAGQYMVKITNKNKLFTQKVYLSK
jgi:hypothetical protein